MPLGVLSSKSHVGVPLDALCVVIVSVNITVVERSLYSGMYMRAGRGHVVEFFVRNPIRNPDRDHREWGPQHHGSHDGYRL